MVAMETTTVMKILISFLVNILKMFKGAKFDYDEIKEENVMRSRNFQIFLFLTTLKAIYSTEPTFLNLLIAHV